MNYIRTLDKVYKTLQKEEGFREEQGQNKLFVSFKAILDYLKEYEVGIPQNYYNHNISGVKDWFLKEHFNHVLGGNTQEFRGMVLSDFLFAQFNHPKEDYTYVVMVYYLGNPFYKDYLNKDVYEPIVFKFPIDTSFYEVLDEISLESSLINTQEIEINKQKYILIPRILSDKPFVFDIEQQELLDTLDLNILDKNNQNIKKLVNKNVDSI